MYPQCRRSAPPGAYIIYPEAQNRGKAAAASSASTWDSGNGGSSSRRQQGGSRGCHHVSAASATLQSVREDRLHHGGQQLKSFSHESASHADETSTAAALTSNDSVKKSDICLPQHSVATSTYCEGGSDAAASAATTGATNTVGAETPNFTVSLETGRTSTGKAHGTVMCSAMQ
ncbi:hypothetical protein NXY56_005394 [Leishmania guyanensis]|uniref:Uncharacterized protein n=2 Tax=Viannia TaxID=37616 RepID=A0ABR3E044_9TRYP